MEIPSIVILKFHYILESLIFLVANYLSHLPWIYFVFIFEINVQFVCNSLIYIHFFLKLPSLYMKADFSPSWNSDISRYGPET